MPRIHPHYVNTRFDAPHADRSGESKFFNLSKEGGFWLTRDEATEYDAVGSMFDRVGFDE